MSNASPEVIPIENKDKPSGERAAGERASFAPIGEMTSPVRDAQFSDDAQGRELLSKIDDGVFVAGVVRDETGRAVDFVFLSVNEAFARRAGLSAEAILRRRASEILPDLPSRVIQRLRRVVDRGEPAAFEIEGRAAAERRTYEARVHPLGRERFGGLLLDITERKAVEEALEKRRAWLTAIVNSVDQIIWTSGPDGYVDFYNRRCYEFTGAPPGSAEGDAWIELIHPDDRERTMARWRRYVAVGQPYEVEYRVMDRSGCWRWMLQRARPVRNEADEIIRWIGTCTDIQAQKEYAERYRQLHEANPAPQLILSRDLTIQEASESVLAASMTRLEDLVGQPIDEAFPGNPDDPGSARAREMLRASHERVLKTGKPDRVPVQKYDIRRPNGEFEARWWSVLNVPVLGLDGEVRHILQQVEDLTGEMFERQRAAEARAGEARFRAVAETIPGIVFEADAQARPTYCNSLALAYTGLTLEDLQEDRARHIHPSDRDRDAAMIADILRTPRTHQIELRLRRADGAYRWFQANTSPVLDAEGRLEKWIGVAIDITEQREAAELQRTLLQEVSHRVKNSLAIISCLLRLQARPLQGEPRRALEEASLRVQAVARVHDLLWRGATARDVDVQGFLSDLCSTLASCSPRHETLCSFDAAVVSTEIAVPLGLVLNELLTNAYKYAYPDGAAGEVRARGTCEPDGRYRLDVEDSGVGLPPGFDVRSPGESLGMKVITSLAAQLGAELNVGSAEPGARFSLVFPLDPASASQPALEPAAVQAGRQTRPWRRRPS